MTRKFSFPFIHRTLLALAGSLLWAGPSAPAAEPAFYLKEGDRVVFYGDSITAQQMYTNFVETFVYTRFPGLKVSFVNSGWASDKVSGGLGGAIKTRLERDVFALKPTVVTIMLGMNDGGGKALDEKIFQTYSQGYLQILQDVGRELPDTRVTLILPSPYDDVTQPPKFEGGYNAVLVRFGDFLKKTAEGGKYQVADFNTPVVEVLKRAVFLDATLATKIIPDRVHPDPAGHLIMAEALLKAWNAPGLVSQVEIDAAKKAVVVEKATQVTDLQVGEKISWTQLDTRLPFPVNRGDAAIRLALKASDFMESLNQQPLKMTGLASGTYQLAIDGREVGNFSAEQLAGGINLAEFSTPMSAQSGRVAALVQKQNDIHVWGWRSIQLQAMARWNEDPEMKASLGELLKAIDLREAKVGEEISSAARPVSHKYQLTPKPSNPAP